LTPAVHSILSWTRKPRNAWLVIAIVAGVAQLVAGFLLLHPHPFESVEDHASRLARTHGFVIGYGDPATFFVPPYRPDDAVIADTVMRSADLDKVAPALDGMDEALKVYPPGFVSACVSAIFVAGDMMVGHQRAGGSTGPSWFILSAPDSSSTASVKLNALEGVHHELSSFVLQKAQAASAWARFAPNDSSFTTDNEVALAKAKNGNPSPETGFLSSYAMTTSENDFNTYVERIFTEPETLRALACKHALVRRKLIFVLQTYIELDVRMRETFRNLGFDAERLCRES
jgi:hypothetical protein